jgi:tRNA(adenine34) deaminase
MESSTLTSRFLSDELSLTERDEAFMREALKEAEKAEDEGEVPVGAVVVMDGRVVGRAHNQRETLKDPTAHAEMIALTQAAAWAGAWRLSGATMYVTMEPCLMCAGALVLARVDRLVYGCPDPKAGACGSLYNILSDERLNHRLEAKAGVLAEQCAEAVQSFFKARRLEGEP